MHSFRRHRRRRQAAAPQEEARRFGLPFLEICRFSTRCQLSTHCQLSTPAPIFLKKPFASSAATDKLMAGAVGMFSGRFLGRRIHGRSFGDCCGRGMWRGETLQQSNSTTPIRQFQSRPEYTPLASVSLAVAVGSMCQDVASVQPDAWFLLGAATIIGWVLLRRAKRDGLAGLVLLTAVACWTAAYASDCWQWRDTSSLALATDERGSLMCIEAEILKVPIVASGQGDRAMHRYEVRAHRVRDRSRWRSASGLGELRVGSGSSGRLSVGDRVRCWGKVQRPRASLNPGEFDFRHYCRARKIDFLVHVNLCQQVIVLRRTMWWSPKVLLSRLRMNTARALKELLPPNRYAIAAALVVGQRGGLAAGQRQAFLVTGVMHLLAISGLHVGMLVGVIWMFERVGWLRRGTALLLAASLAVAFAAFTGAQPPVMRAAMFVSAVAISRWRSREGRPLAVLSAAALLLLLVNPSHLFNTGVQLSFLAVAVLGCYAKQLIVQASADPIDQLVERSRSRVSRMLIESGRRCLSLMFVSFAICVAAAPLTSRVFHVVAPSAILLNLVLGPITAIVLISGLLAAVLQATLGLGWLPGQVCSLSIGAMISLLEFTEQLSYASHWTGGPPRWWMFGFYGLFAVATWMPVRPLARRTATTLAVWCLSLPIGLVLQCSEPPRLRCTVLSMGHGACVLLQTPNGSTLVYDVGSLGAPTRAGRRAAEASWAQRIRRIDTVVISHADADHFNGLDHLALRFPIRRLLVSQAFLKNRAGCRVAERMRDRGVQVAVGLDGDLICADPSVAIRVLQPSNSEQATDNAQSLLLLAKYGGKTILLTGDLEKEGMVSLLASEPRRAHVVLAPHHGSRHSNPRQFVEWSKPDWVIASTGHGRSLSDLSNACQRQDSRLLSTSTAGAVQVEVESNGDLSVRTWRANPWPIH